MAIAHFNVAIVGRSSGKSSVHAAAYASRSRLIDERTGMVHNYSNKAGDIVASWVWLPKDAPEALRDRAALWNQVESKETRINSQLARRIILALPHELTAKQQEMLLKDYVRENFTRKRLAADVSIHKPHEQGDHRNDHAHILIPTRFIGKEGLGQKDRDSNRTEMLREWRDNWESLVNRHLERHGHEARISMKTLDAQGIDRTPQIHLGQGASALQRKGIANERGDMLQEIANDNRQRGQAVTRDLGPGFVDSARPDGPEAVAGHEIANDNQRPTPAELEFIDRDRQDQEWEETVIDAGIAHDEARRQQFYESLRTERAALEQQGQDMAVRHGEALSELEPEGQGDAPGHAPPAAPAKRGFFSFLSFFAGIPGLFRGKSAPGRKTSQGERHDQEKARREQLEKEQAEERKRWEKRLASLIEQHAYQQDLFERQLREVSPLRRAFDSRLERPVPESETPKPTPAPDDTLKRMAERKEAQRERDGLDFGR